MKTNRFFAAILSMALCVNFVSCGDDDDNDIINQGNGSKRLVSCTLRNDTYGFTYGSDGKLSSMAWDDDFYDFSFSGNEAVATAVSTYNEYTHIDTVWFTFNEKGDCASAIWKTIEKSSTSSTFYQEDIETYKFIYNSDNQMIKAEIYDENSEREDEDDYVYVYKDGVMVSSSFAETITYTGIPNIGNLFVAWDTNSEDLDAWRLAGLLGKAPKFLPKTVEWEEYLGAIYKETYDYELDEEGYVKKVEVVEYDERGKEIDRDICDFNYESIK